MSLRGSSRHITICEILREINDEHQSDSEHDKLIRRKLVIAEGMAKKMSSKLKEYNKEVFRGWWERNPDYEKDLDKRLNEKYCVEDKEC